MRLIDKDRIFPRGEKYFPFRNDPFPEEALCAGSTTGSHNICLPCKTRKENQL